MAKQKKKKKKKQHRVFWFFIKLQIFLMVLILGGLCFYYFGGYADKVAKLHSEAVELVQKSDKNTFLPARRVHSTIQTVMRYPRRPLPKRLTM